MPGLPRSWRSEADYQAAVGGPDAIHSLSLPVY